MKTAFTITASDPAARRAIREVFDIAHDRDDTPARFCSRQTLRGCGHRIVCNNLHASDVRSLADTLLRRSQLRAGTTKIEIE